MILLFINISPFKKRKYYDYSRKPTERTANSLLSVVIPMYQEGSHVKNTIKVIEKILVDNHITYEFILVDDGSTDNTFSELKSLAKDNDKVSAIRLSRNFGKESALCAGLDYAAGDMILVMDADLQHPPHIIPDMVNAWLNEGFDVVEGVKRSRGKKIFCTGHVPSYSIFWSINPPT